MTVGVSSLGPGGKRAHAQAPPPPDGRAPTPDFLLAPATALATQPHPHVTQLFWCCRQPIKGQSPRPDTPESAVTSPTFEGGRAWGRSFSGGPRPPHPTPPRAPPASAHRPPRSAAARQRREWDDAAPAPAVAAVRIGARGRRAQHSGETTARATAHCTLPTRWSPPHRDSHGVCTGLACPWGLPPRGGGCGGALVGQLPGPPRGRAPRLCRARAPQRPCAPSCRVPADGAPPPPKGGDARLLTKGPRLGCDSHRRRPPRDLCAATAPRALPAQVPVAEARCGVFSSPRATAPALVAWSIAWQASRAPLHLHPNPAPPPTRTGTRPPPV